MPRTSCISVNSHIMHDYQWANWILSSQCWLLMNNALNPSSSEPTLAFRPCRSTPCCADVRLLVCSYVFTGEVIHFTSVSLVKFCGHSLLCFCSPLQATVQHLTPSYLFLIKRSYHSLDFWNSKGWASGSALYCFPWRYLMSVCVYTFLWERIHKIRFIE